MVLFGSSQYGSQCAHVNSFLKGFKITWIISRKLQKTRQIYDNFLERKIFTQLWNLTYFLCVVSCYPQRFSCYNSFRFVQQKLETKPWKWQAVCDWKNPKNKRKNCNITSIASVYGKVTRMVLLFFLGSAKWLSFPEFYSPMNPFISL